MSVDLSNNYGNRELFIVLSYPFKYVHIPTILLDPVFEVWPPGTRNKPDDCTKQTGYPVVGCGVNVFTFKRKVANV